MDKTRIIVVEDNIVYCEFVLHHDDSCFIHFRIFPFFFCLPDNFSTFIQHSRSPLCISLRHLEWHFHEVGRKVPSMAGRHGESAMNFADGV